MAEFMLFLKLHSTRNGTIVAMCDEELIGKVLKEGKKELDLDKYSNFYKGDLMSKDDAKKVLKDVDFISANIVGKESISVLKELQKISHSDIGSIAKVPFVHVYNLVI